MYKNYVRLLIQKLHQMLDNIYGVNIIGVIRAKILRSLSFPVVGDKLHACVLIGVPVDSNLTKKSGHMCYVYPHAKDNASYFYETWSTRNNCFNDKFRSFFLKKRVYRLPNRWVDI